MKNISSSMAQDGSVALIQKLTGEPHGFSPGNNILQMKAGFKAVVHTYLLSFLVTAGAVPLQAQETGFHGQTGIYSELLDSMRSLMQRTVYTRSLRGKERRIFVPWIRDHVHATKGLKYWEQDIRSFLELFLETQHKSGLFMDYIYPIEHDVNNRFNFFESRYVRTLPRDRIQMHRLPVEADVEYLVVEGAHQYFMASGDTAFVRQWLPNLVKGLRYLMTDPQRWYEPYQLVKRGYTIDTWDFQFLPMSIPEYAKRYGDPTQGIMNLVDTTFFGIMHGDNSGLYAACRQVADMYEFIGESAEAEAWRHQANMIRVRANSLLWNGRYYMHYLPAPQSPPYLRMDHRNTLSLSNPYDINRGLPDSAMAASIIRVYRELKESTRDSSIAEWFSLYPAYRGDWAGHAEGTYVNGGLLTIVAGELAKAAFNHGFEQYGVDILQRVHGLLKKHGALPGCYQLDGTIDGGLPDSWGQAALTSALVEGLGGVVESRPGFQEAVLSLRWPSAGINDAGLEVHYPSSGTRLRYDYKWDVRKRSMTLFWSGSPKAITCRFLLPEGTRNARIQQNGRALSVRLERVGNSLYACTRISGASGEVRLTYQ